MAVHYYQGCKGKVPGEKDYVERLRALKEYEQSQKWIAEPKYDGIWCAAVNLDGTTRYISRQGQEKNSRIPLDLPKGTILIGELAFGSQESIRRVAKVGHPFMDVYDCLMHRGEEIHHYPREFRQLQLTTFYVTNGNHQQYFRRSPEFKERFCEEYMNQHEGLILKPRDDGPYLMNGSKVPQWLKAKKSESDDYIILSWTQSQAETKVARPMAKCIHVGGWVPIEKVKRGEEVLDTCIDLQNKHWALIELLQVGAMLNEMSIDVADNFDAKYRGKVIEVGHYGRFDSGAGRHPYIVKMRDSTDKSPADCKFRV